MLRSGFWPAKEREGTSMTLGMQYSWRESVIALARGACWTSRSIFLVVICLSNIQTYLTITEYGCSWMNYTEDEHVLGRKLVVVRAI